MKRLVVVGVFLMCLTVAPARAAVIFSDDFNTGAHAAWGNESGDWAAPGGVYYAQNPDNVPAAYSSVTSLTGLTDFAVEVDVNNVTDGGIFLRSTYLGSGYSVGVSGVVLIFAHNQLYWHITDGHSWGTSYNSVSYSDSDRNSHFKITVEGNLYSAYLNGGAVPATTLTTTTFASGSVGLYDYAANQSFDNFQVSVDANAVPIPGAVWLLGSGLVGLVGLRRKRRF